MIRAAALALALLSAPGSGAAQQTFEPYTFAVLGGMDKVTGRISTFELPVGVTGAFGALEITPRTCRKTPPDETPESASFLQIRDYLSGEGVTVFSGWMFASSPGVSALEHPVYDVWVIDCTNSASPPSGRE